MNLHTGNFSVHVYEMRKDKWASNNYQINNISLLYIMDINVLYCNDIWVFFTFTEIKNKFFASWPVQNLISILHVKVPTHWFTIVPEVVNQS